MAIERFVRGRLTALTLVVAMASPVIGSDARPLVEIVSPPPTSSGDCLLAGQRRTLAGRWVDHDPSTGANRPPRELTVEIETTHGDVEVYRPSMSEDGLRWEISDVDLGGANGMAMATVRAVGESGKIARAVRSWIVDADTPRIRVTVNGSRVGGDAWDGEPKLYGHPVRVSAWVEDNAYAMPPDATLELDGDPVKRGTTVDRSGLHRVVARVEDCAGHRAQAEWTFRLALEPSWLFSTTPADGAVVADGPEEFSGTTHLDIVSAVVNGQQTQVVEGRFSVTPFRWLEGRNLVEIDLETAGGSRRRYRTKFTVHSIGPWIELLEYGLPIAPGTVFRRPVKLEVRATGTDVTVEAWLNGAPFVSGTKVEESGSYRFEAEATDSLGRTVRGSSEFAVDIPPPRQ